MSRVTPSLQDARNAQRGQMKKIDNQLNAFVAHNQENLEIWSSLDHLLLECQALRTSPSHALLLIKNQELVNRAVEDKTGLLEAAKVLAKDVNDYGQKLAAIEAAHAQLVADRKGDPTVSPDTLANVMAIGEDYSNWITSYQLVVIPSAYNVTAFFAHHVQVAPTAIQPLADAPAASI